MLNKACLLLISVSLFYTNAFSAEPFTHKSVDPETGEVISSSSTDSPQKTTPPSAHLCLEGQSVIETKTDGTVRCYDKINNTETSYINIDLKSQQRDTLSNNTYKTTSTKQSMVCPEGKALARLHSNGSIECE